MSKVPERVSDTELSKLSVRELTDLQMSIHTAIRAAIRRVNEAKLHGRDASAIARPAEPEARTSGLLGLAEERDAWLARRKL